MRGGHNRLPRKVKEKRGTLRRCREAPAASEADPSKVPPPPKGVTAIQRTVWKELAAQVEALGVYAASDLTAFRLMVETVAETRDFDPRDPATARVRTRQVAAGLLQRFGLDPGSRGRVGAVAPEKEDTAAKFLFGGAPALQVVKGGGSGQ